jgi:fibronectin type 3 domain-containing protein
MGCNLRWSALSSALAVSFIVLFPACLVIVTPGVEGAVVVDPSVQEIFTQSGGPFYSSLAIGPLDVVHVSFRDRSSLDLDHATDLTGSWAITTVDNARGIGDHSSIAVDADGRVHVSYWDQTDDDLRYAMYSGGGWVLTTIDSGTAGWNSSIAVDSQGGVHIAYSSGSGLKYATDASGSWEIATIDGSGGAYPSISVASDGQACVLYSVGSDLRYAAGSSGWTSTVVTSANGRSGSLALDSQDHAHICYMAASGLWYGTNKDDSWNLRQIEVGAMGDTAAIALSSSDRSHIVYVKDDGDVDRIRYATDLGGSWSTHDLDVSRGPPASPEHFYLGSQDAVAVDSQGRVHLTYSNGSDDSETSSLRHASFVPRVVTAPGSPTNLAGTPGDARVQLSWSAPSNNGGSPIIGYRLYWSLSSGGPFTAITIAGTSFLHSGLLNGHSYYYKVAAVNAVGESSSSTMVSATPMEPPSAPSAPGGLTARGGVNNITLNWTLPADDGGQAITGYKVYRGSTSTSLSYLDISTARTYQDTSVTAGRAYFYQVSAVNSVGEGSKSSVVSGSSFVRPAVPGNFTASGGNGYITLTWVAPGSDGGSVVTSYRIYRGTSEASLSLLNSTGNASYTDLAVTVGTTYHYAVTAVNAVGEGDRSATATTAPTVAPSAPSMPQEVHAALLGENLRITWSPPARDGGSAVTSYQIYRGVSPNALLFLASTPALEHLDTTAVRGITYYYAVAAINVIGEGARGSVASAAVPLPSLPAPPLDLVARAESGKAYLTWSAPDSNGGSPVIGYRIFRGATPEMMAFIATADGTSYEDFGLQDGGTYIYAVAAVNEVGEGERTDGVAVTMPTNPLVASPMWFLASVGVATVSGSVVYLIVHRMRSATR